jgi:hypothetical protein
MPVNMLHARVLLSMGDLKNQLAAIFPLVRGVSQPVNTESVEQPWLPETGCTCPAYCEMRVLPAFGKYSTELLGRDIEDPRGICVSLCEENFPKLLKLWLKPEGKLPARKARAKNAIPLLRNGQFDEQLYTWEKARLRTLFWLEDVISNPDGIYGNCAKLIEGEEVYIKRYAKEGSPIKLVFTTIRSGGLRVVVTSFLDNQNSLKDYCLMPSLYQKNKATR